MGVFTSSWTAPNKAECHLQQRFHYLGSRGEICIDQAHRGYASYSSFFYLLVTSNLRYEMTTDSGGRLGRHG